MVAACNKNWLAKLPVDLRAVVTEEASRIEASTNEFGAKDILSAQEAWTKNGGQMVAMNANDAASFSKLVNESAMAILREKPALLAEFERYAKACQKYKA